MELLASLLLIIILAVLILGILDVIPLERYTSAKRYFERLGFDRHEFSIYDYYFINSQEFRITKILNDTLAMVSFEGEEFSILPGGEIKLKYFENSLKIFVGRISLRQGKVVLFMKNSIEVEKVDVISRKSLF